MNLYSLPWVEIALLAPLLASLWARWLRDPESARRHSLIACGLTLAAACLAWFGHLSADDAAAPRDVLLNDPLFSLNDLSAPLLPLVALLYLLTALATLGAKVRRFSFSSMLVSEAILLATLSCRHSWLLVALLLAGTVPPLAELLMSRRPARVYAIYMALFAALLVGGQVLLTTAGGDPLQFNTGLLMLAAATLVRGGVFPVHSWMPDLFEHASFGTALLFVTPMVSTYATLRLVFPIAPDWVLHVLAALTLVTALYGAGMALVQRDARRLFAYFFLSHSSLVLFGVTMATPVGLTAALCGWIAVSLSMAGFGLTLRAIETRTGRLLLNDFHGLVSYTPRLAALFLITGLASIGFPGTIGFVGTELLVDGAAQTFPFAGIVIVLTAALNGLAVLYAYFRVFTGTRHEVSIDLRSRPPERFAVLVLSALILGGGLYPQPGVESRYRVAVQLTTQRGRSLTGEPPALVARAGGRDTVDRRSPGVAAVRPASRPGPTFHAPASTAVRPLLDR
ncbi:MAG: proton-conducting transporter membrane subunit [Pirellulales bacterium]